MSQQPIEFAKLSGSGNDFLCIDNRDGRFDALLADGRKAANIARVLCRRGLGLGADGLIFAGLPEVDGVADVHAYFFEPDGSQAELCGNGTACFIHWVISSGWLPRREVRILTQAGIVKGKHRPGRFVRVCVPTPEDPRPGLSVRANGRLWDCDYVVTGVPHLVAYAEDVDSLELPHWGPLLRYHERFAPRGVNVNFTQVIVPGEISVRTWEFGVEGETLACGTGSASAAIMAALRAKWPKAYLTNRKPVLVHTRGGETLKIWFTRNEGGTVGDVCLETAVRYLSQGTIHPELARLAGL